MKNTKSYFTLVVMCILFLLVSGSWALAYRGCEADRCRRKKSDLSFSSESVNEVINKIAKENFGKESNECIFDYYMCDSEIVVFCRKHGGDSNCSMLSNMSVDSYYGERFNNTAFYCMVFLVPMAIVIKLFRSFKKKKK